MNNSTEREEVTELTKELIKYKTTSENTEELRKCINYCEEYFSDTKLITKRYNSKNKPSLVVLTENTKEPEIMLHGHIDVVKAPEKMFTPETREGKLYGRGTADMKAGVACLMKVMRDLDKNKTDLSIGLMITSDEEIGGFDGTKYLIEDEEYRPNFGITAEPNSVEENYFEIVAKQKGVLKVVAKTEGEACHGSQPWLGDNAGDKLAKKYLEIREKFPSGNERTEDTTISLKYMHADAKGRIPDEGEMKFTVYTSDNYNKEDVKEDLKDIEGLNLEFKLDEPMLDTNYDDYYVQKLKKAAGDTLGKSCEVTWKSSASDMRFLSDIGIPAVVFGPEAYNSHGDKEYAETGSFSDYIEIIKKFVKLLDEDAEDL